MFTKNARALMLSSVVLNYLYGNGGTIEVTRTNGTKVYAFRAPTFNSNNVNVNYYYNESYAGIKIGSGTTPPTQDDYSMGSIIPNNSLACTLVSTRTYMEDNDACAQHVLSVTNKSSNDITITEIGLVHTIQASPQAGSTYNGGDVPVLVDRTLLATPLTIPSSESATITYTIKASISTATA